MNNYIKWIREKVGHECIFLNFAGACIKNNKGEILLQERADKKGWGFLGGAIEIGESLKEAVIREVKEESGFDIKVDKLLGVYSKYVDSYPNGDKAQTITVFFKCSIINIKQDEFDKNETKRLKFYDINNIPKLFNQQHRDALKDLLNGNYASYN